jgi:hypothetical protein
MVNDSSTSIAKYLQIKIIIAQKISFETAINYFYSLGPINI